ncbi:MAG: succinate dehydrogenase, cytochrome b556 subunit [Roseibium album]|uniref:Succinate dehydrogenase cytochrome b556 subunit n=1 Tax=Roseibium album TaxID=311410 RepID=A0A0M6ZEQ0_9HYPH|nr:MULTISPECIES: succinate dehydrogenase, cytochrome b556 subunit [Stappiaceae]MBG6144419.1 succinate dehydrogenase / fumarate reductase cytochrome b subunit [Labrenzia sp. EL_142]MBG6154181.1 succinate dehydrogenase / fumarate reductase cytochrome b subunit [Labrenzia sp. EL_162]MBG6164508.1 succinate dehydrogenase / fumarate reductase cytochrome b subunit [Labrenzia sp. EL_195]MBG6175050.1 succinate dehydrogenase / fumarate reductase cytochrome b subunit [Labrenzia sp. EL_132]MBG6193690.1 su
MSNADLRGNRPLSPHLQIYKPILTMVMSILHRITGAALYFGTILLAWWLIAAAAGPSYFDFVNEIYGSILGRLILFGFTWALVHHMLGGLRHFIWDMGAGFGKEAREWLAKATIIGSVSLTLILWIIGYMVR